MAEEAFPWGAVMQLGSSLLAADHTRTMGRINYSMQARQYQAARVTFDAQQGIAAAQHSVAMGQAAMQNAMVAAQNDNEKTEAGLANFMTAENNRRRLEASGAAINAAVVTLARRQEATTSDSLEQRISEAEAMGAYAANAALAGVGGASVDAIENAMRLKAARAEQYRVRNNGYLDYDAAAEIAGMKAAQYGALDQTVVTPGVNLSKYMAGIYVPGVFTAAAPQRPDLGGLGSDLIGLALGNRTAAGQIADYADKFFTSKRTAMPFSDTGDY